MLNTSNPNKNTIAVLYQPAFLGSFAVIFLQFGLPIYGKSLGASALAIGGLYSVFTFMIMILRPIVGWALDRFGRKRFFVLALLSYTLAMGIFAFAESLGWLYLARLVQGIAASGMLISVRTMAADLASPKERGQAMGRVQEMTTRGSMVGLVSAMILFSYFAGGTAWQLAFLGYAFLGATGAWLAWQKVPETRLAPSPSATGDRRPTSRQFLLLLTLVFTTGLTAAMLSPIYLIFLQDKFTTNFTTLAWAFVPAGIVASVLPSRLGRLSDRFGRTPPMVAGLAGAGLLTFLLPRLPSISWLVILYTLSAVGRSMAKPATTAMVADLTGNETRGTAYGLHAFAGSLGATIGPLLGGWMYDTIGHATPFYLNGAVLCVNAIWVGILLKQPSHRATKM